MAYNKRKCFGSGLQCKKIHVCKDYVSRKKCNGGCHVLHERGLLTRETKEILAWLQVTTNAKELLGKLLICSDDKTYNGCVNDDDDDYAAELEVSDVEEEMDELLAVDLCKYFYHAASKIHCYRTCTSWSVWSAMN